MYIRLIFPFQNKKKHECHIYIYISLQTLRSFTYITSINTFIQKIQVNYIEPLLLPILVLFFKKIKERNIPEERY